jgi:hypothetical protein
MHPAILKRKHISIPRLLYNIRSLCIHSTAWTAWVRFPEVQDFSLLHSVQTGSGAHPASYQMGTGGSFPGGKAAGGV